MISAKDMVPMTSEFPIFSVIMPCYNSEAYVMNAVESLKQQTWTGWELIVVNDGSEDGTLQILQEYAAKDSRISVYSKENGGYVSAVNLGLNYISGDYFLVMGSDDTLALDLFEKLAAAAKGRRPDCIAFQTELIKDGLNAGTEELSRFEKKAEKFDTTLAEFAEEFPLESEIFFARDTSKCYHRRLLGDLRYFGHHGLDSDGIFSMLLCHRADSFLVLPVPGYYWTVRRDSLSGTKRTVQLNCDCISNWIHFFREVNQNGYQLAKAETQYFYYLIQLIQSVAEQQAGQQKKLLREASDAIMETAKRIGYDLDLSKRDRVLLKYPRIWKLLQRFFS